MLFVNLHVSRKEIDCAWVVVFVCDASSGTHLLDDDEKI